MAVSPITTRLPDWLDAELKEVFSTTGEGRSEGLRRVAEEWWTLEHLPGIEFRDGYSRRRASVRGGPDVWEIVMVARDYGDDRAGLQAHFGWLEPEKIDQALAYAQRFSAQIQGEIDANDRAGRVLEEQFDKAQRNMRKAG